MPQYSPFFCFFVHGTPVARTVAIHIPGILTCSYPVLIEYNPFSIRKFKKFLSSTSRPVVSLLCGRIPPVRSYPSSPSQQPSVRQMYIPIKSAINAAPIASLKSDHIRSSFSHVDVSDSLSSITSVGFGDSGSDM